MGKSFHYINVIHFSNTFFVVVWYMLVMKQLTATTGITFTIPACTNVFFAVVKFS